ncbi:hypothetical protein [Paraburkholderia aromaticivorans]|nr:hypothetical protein [Paraburkholderia aromaticivorans]
MNEQQANIAAMTEQDFAVTLTMFKPEERAALMEAMRAAVKDAATA